MKAWSIVEGDCLEVVQGLEASSFDAVVTDPPYGLEFMGVKWDTFADRPKGRRPPRSSWGDHGSREHARVASEAAGVRLRKARAFQDFTEAWAIEALRVLKPGGHLVAFGAPRLYHRLACGLEDAGFEVRDGLMWLFGQGYPKSLDLSKAIDRAAGAEREVVGRWKKPGRGSRSPQQRYGLTADEGEITAPATDAAKAWAGWGTALKPGWEGIVLARKALEADTIAANVLEHGTGGVNVDACRVAMSAEDAEVIRNAGGFMRKGYDRKPGVALELSTNPMPTRDAEPHGGGRWPANVLLDEDAAAELDQQTGEQRDGVAGKRGAVPSASGFLAGVPARDTPWGGYGAGGGASRFFYTAKASSAERHEDQRAAVNPERNAHPTVKPLALMRWLVRLVTPPGGRVLEPFCGSGTTVLACLDEGFEVYAVELDQKTAAFARRRVESSSPLFRGGQP